MEAAGLGLGILAEYHRVALSIKNRFRNYRNAPKALTGLEKTITRLLGHVHDLMKGKCQTKDGFARANAPFSCTHSTTSVHILTKALYSITGSTFKGLLVKEISHQSAMTSPNPRRRQCLTFRLAMKRRSLRGRCMLPVIRLSILSTKISVKVLRLSTKTARRVVAEVVDPLNVNANAYAGRSS